MTLMILMMPQFLLQTVLSVPAWTFATVCCVMPLNTVLISYSVYRILWHLLSVNLPSSAFSLWKSLHWLPVRQRVIYKTALITYKTLKTGEPAYLYDLLHHQPTRTLRASSHLLLCQPVTRIDFRCKAFSIIAPAVRNSSAVTRCCTIITTFKAHLKVNCSLLHMTPSGISSTAGASNLIVPPIRTLDLWHRL